ncbi:MAG TPA: chromate efflux transporter [Pyrinomonadaceae bacterium]|jgi:chromate transporter
MSKNLKENISFGEAFRFWLKLGFISFGGPAGQIAIMQKELVEKRRWIEQEDFLHALNFCMLLPGPEAQQLATYIGWRLHGLKGGLVAGAFFVIPSIFFLLALSYVYAAYGNVPHVSAVLDGFKAVVVAIVVEAVLKIARKAFKSRWHAALAALAFLGIHFLRVPFPLIVLAAALLGTVLLKTEIPDEAPAGENRKPETKNRSLKIIAAFAVLWLIPFLAVVSIFGFDNIAAKTYLFFTQAAFVTFGGAYAVLAYVNQAAVAAGWMTAAQTVDGLALAETTPGPLIMVLQFIGFMTGWNHPGAFHQTPFAILCALLTTYVTFLPSFLFIFLGAPYIERLRRNRRLASALSGVMAAVVGVILNLALTFGAAVVFPQMQMNVFALALAVFSFIALYFLKADVLAVVVAGGLCGLAKYFLIG